MMVSANGASHESSMAALDRYIAPGLRLWMLIALVSGIMLVMVVIVCCFMKIRIPRTKRQIDLIAARRKMRKSKIPPPQHHQDGKIQPIVMNTPKSSTHKNNSMEGAESAPLVQQSTPHTTTTV